MARQAPEAGDDGTGDRLGERRAIRKNERQVWFVAEHLVDTPLTAHEA